MASIVHVERLIKYHERVGDRISKSSPKSAIQEGSPTPEQLENSADTPEVLNGVAFDNLDETHQISYGSTSKKKTDIDIFPKRSKQNNKAPDRLIQYLMSRKIILYVGSDAYFLLSGNSTLLKLLYSSFHLPTFHFGLLLVRKSS